MGIKEKFTNLSERQKSALLTLLYTVFVVAFICVFAPKGTLKISFFLVVAASTILSCYFNRRRGLFLGLGLVCAFIVIEYVSKRMGGWWFHQVPVEMISITLATNLDEIQSAMHFSKRETVFLTFTVIGLITFFWPAKLKNETAGKVVIFSLLSMIMGGQSRHPTLP